MARQWLKDEDDILFRLIESLTCTDIDVSSGFSGQIMGDFGRRDQLQSSPILFNPTLRAKAGLRDN